MKDCMFRREWCELVVFCAKICTAARTFRSRERHRRWTKDFAPPQNRRNYWHTPAVQIPEQQSVPTLHATLRSWQGRSQNPATQSREQHCALVAQLLPVV
jgi:hypothetical protein